MSNVHVINDHIKENSCFEYSLLYYLKSLLFAAWYLKLTRSWSMISVSGTRVLLLQAFYNCKQPTFWSCQYQCLENCWIQRGVEKCYSYTKKLKFYLKLTPAILRLYTKWNTRKWHRHLRKVFGPKQKHIRGTWDPEILRPTHDPLENSFPSGIYLLKVNNRNTRTRYEICSTLTI